MADPALHGRHILVVEDEYMLADELRGEFADAGAIVIGPVGSLSDALDLIARTPRIDGAILDISLGDMTTFAAADLLMARAIPFLFTTGYAKSTIPPRFAAIGCCDKPVDLRRVLHALARAIHD